mgnify:FL=1|tara:strand:- start:150 stop:1007 length:858 start_codon:yes stop_codon:yes gene_type:complete
MAERIHSSDTQLFINGTGVPAINSLSISSSKEVEDIARLGTYHTTERIIKSNQTSSLSIGMFLTTGATGVDPIYNPQKKEEGFLSTGKFDFQIKDLVGVTTITGASMTSYSINGSVGSLVEGSTSYEGDGATFTSAGAISMSEQRTDNFGGFFLPRNIEITTTETDNGKEAVNTSALNIQSFDISVDIPRRAVKRLGSRHASFRYPELPARGSLSFSMIKNLVTGLDLSETICDSGIIKIDLKDDSNDSLFHLTTSGCCLESVEESTALDDNTTINFSYYFPIIQ